MNFPNELNCLKKVIEGIKYGTIIVVIKGDTRRLDHSSNRYAGPVGRSRGSFSHAPLVLVDVFALNPKPSTLYVLDSGFGMYALELRREGSGRAKVEIPCIPVLPTIPRTMTGPQGMLHKG